MAELIKVKTLLASKTVKLKANTTSNASDYKAILDQTPTSLTGEVVDTLTNLSAAVTLTTQLKLLLN